MKNKLIPTIYKATHAFSFLLLLIFSIKTAAQPVNNLVKDVVMPAPNAAALGKYGDIPVSYYTGVPNIDIPIYTAQSGPLSVPISINYHASGIKVAETASWVGMGWSLSAGGMITRTVQGIADERPFGYYMNGSNVSLATNGITPQIVHEAASGQKDAEPDIFSFNVSGYNGKFYFDKDKTAQFIPKQDFKILEPLIVNNDFVSFTLLTPDGTRFTFGQVGTTQAFETSHVFTSAPFSTSSDAYISSWYLLKIETPDLAFNINFTYENDNYSYKNVSSCRKVIQFCTDNTGNISGLEQNSCSTPTSNGLIVTSIAGKRLKTIQTPTETITFNALTDRLDIDNSIASATGATSKKMLDNIVISTGIAPNAKISTWNFIYDYFLDNTSFTPTSKDRRLKLLSVQETDGAISKPPHTFEYNGNFIVNRHSKAIDHWGFYNAQIANEGLEFNFPSTTVAGFTRGSANRESDEASMKMGVLTKINYPTGGYSQFEFEANRVPKGSTVSNRILSLISCTDQLPLPGNTSAACCGSRATGALKPFTPTQLQNNIKFTLTLDASTIDDLDPACSGVISKVTIKVYTSQNGTYLGEKSLNIKRSIGHLFRQNTYPITDIYTNFQANTDYYYELTSTNCYAEFSLDVTIPITVDRIVGGLRVKSIKSNDNLNTQDIIRSYQYLEPDNASSSGVLFKEPVYGYLANGYSVSLSNSVFTNNISFESQSVVPLGSFDGYHIGYHHVKELFNGIGYKSHLYYYTIPITNNRFPIPPTSFQKESGQKVAEMTYNNSSTTPVASKEFVSTPENYTYNSGVIFKAVSIPIICTGNIPTNPQVAYTTYSIRTDAFRLARTEDMIDGVKTITNYSYSDDLAQPLFPITTSMTNSDGSITTTTNKYITHPDFLNSTNDTISKAAKRMKTLNIIANPIETVSQVGSFQTNGSRMIFSCFNSSGLPTNDTLNNYPYPYKFYKYKMTFDGNYQPQVFPSNGGWDLEGTINEYDPLKGKPKKFSMPHWADPELYTWANNGLIETRKFKDFTWAYEYYPNTRLVKKITNMDGQYSLFEYDNFQRVTKATARGGAAVTDYTYKYQDATQSFKNWIETKTTFTAPIGGLLFSNTTYKTARQYLDGLGRPIQSVAVANSPEGKDVISAVAYDNQGREWKKYEPYQSDFSNGSFIAPTNQLFTEMKYEQSPLSRIWKSILPNGWESANTVYGSNTGNDAYNINTWSNYTAGTVYKTTTTDPDGRISIVYTNKTGNKIQTEQTKPGSPLNTMFYNYDHKSRLSRVYTVRNQYEEWFTAGDIDYLYAYDWHDNLIQKYIPGQAYVGFTYNERNQMILTHDGNMRSNFKWLATTYDTYGRITATGMTPYLTYIDPVGNPAIVDSLSSTIYSSATAGIELGKPKRTRSFYNNGANNIETLFDYDSYGRVNNASSNNHLYTPSGVISATNFSEKITTTYDLADNVLLKTRTHKPNATTTRTINETMDYDNGLRLKQVKHQLDALPEQIVSLMDYTLKNQVQTKQMGKVGSLPFLQKVDYSYNVLGFLTGINNTAGLSGSFITSGTNCAPSPLNSSTSLDDNDLFMLDLRYDNPNSAYAPVIAGTQTAISQRNGNISQAVWQVRGREKQVYTFEYDFLNRMTVANYAEINTAGAKTNDQNKYMEKLTYDGRGNINTLKRNGLNATSCTVGMIDDLTYYYNDNNTAGFSPGNRLKRVVDASDKTKGFKTPTTNTNPTDPTYLYTYDPNGNLKTDKNKDITNITYNHLNLPTLITFTGNRTIAFLYDGNGTKLKKTVVNNGVTDLIQDYVGGIEYKTTPSVPIALEAIYHSEGRITTINGSLKYEYALRDHLGNTRLMFSDKNNDGGITQSLSGETSEVTQENSYYPFGLAMEGVWGNTPSVLDNKYQFNGIEMNNDFGLDMNTAFYRAYDATLGRWWQIDPKPNFSESTYVGMGNNPFRFADMLGDTARGVDAQSAQRAQGIIINTFAKKIAGGMGFASLIKLGKDGKTFLPISRQDFKSATKNLTREQKQLAKGYMNAINDKTVHAVEVRYRSEKISENSAKNVAEYTNENGIKSISQADGNYGGGFSSTYNYDDNIVKLGSGTYSLVVMNSVSGDSPEELLAHELGGHGGNPFIKSWDNSVNAIQASNIYYKAMGINKSRGFDVSHGDPNRMSDPSYQNQLNQPPPNMILYPWDE